MYPRQICPKMGGKHADRQEDQVRATKPGMTAHGPSQVNVPDGVDVHDDPGESYGTGCKKPPENNPLGRKRQGHGRKSPAGT